MFNLGKRLTWGVGARIDDAAAISLFERAAAQGHESAMVHLIHWYEFGPVHNPTKGAFWERQLKRTEKVVAFTEAEL